MHVLGIFLFLDGFLLTRLVLPDKSECAVPPVSLSKDDYTPGSTDRGCWHPKTFSKAIVIVVDALRYDFTVPFDQQNKTGAAQPFHDALPLFYDTAVQTPGQAILLPFIADPPTTTLVRIKGLTTGSLPTFVEAGSNFGGEAIQEDNLIAQLYNAGKKLVLLGDDTWKALFPTYFDAKLSVPYFSLTVEDLYTVDTGVTDHLFPLLDKANSTKWDLIVGHYLGVDHAGHRYGPDHSAMTGKLREMNDVFTRLIQVIDDDTLLVVMGDHGMDSRGNHGGESDDEVEAALWMYSKRSVFGRPDGAGIKPPPDAKTRPVRQVDLVPTLALLLGMPIPFNNLGRPIDEAFASRTDSDFPNLAKVNRLAAAQIHRYQETYSKAQELETDTSSELAKSWKAANIAWEGTQEMKYPPLGTWKYAHQAYAIYQRRNLQECRDRWASFNLGEIGCGIFIVVLAFTSLTLFARSPEESGNSSSDQLLARGGVGLVLGAASGAAMGGLEDRPTIAFLASLGCIAGLLSVLLRSTSILPSPRSLSFWSWSCITAILLLCIGFAANSFTIWEDEILLFMLSSFGVLFLVSSLRHKEERTRIFGAWQSISFIIITRGASLSRACREEQKSACSSTYFASASSTSSAWWQLMIPGLVLLFLPGAVMAVFSRSKNYQGSAKTWLGTAFRIALALCAVYWLLEAAEAKEWVQSISPSFLKSVRSLTAQSVLAIAYAAGYSTYIYAGTFVGLEERAAEAAAPQIETKSTDPNDPNAEVFTSLASTPKPKPKLLVLGHANTHGTRYALLLTIWILSLLLVQKPMGQGALSLCLVSIFNLLEIIDVNELRETPVGPIVLGLLGSFYFFKTGHQATLASIQWESAFVATKSVVYPWGPMFVTFNTLGPQILCAIAVPATILWKIAPAQKPETFYKQLGKAMALHLMFYAAICLATIVETAWLRRHLMLYRVFMPRMLLGVIAMIVVEISMLLVALSGVWWSTLSVSKTFASLSLSMLHAKGFMA